MGLAGVYVYVGLVILLAAKWKLIRNAKTHRKFIHIMVGNIVFIWWVFDTSCVMAFLAAAPFIPLLILASPHSSVKKLKESFIGNASGEGYDYGLVYYADVLDASGLLPIRPSHDSFDSHRVNGVRRWDGWPYRKAIREASHPRP